MNELTRYACISVALSRCSANFSVSGKVLLCFPGKHEKKQKRQFDEGKTADYVDSMLLSTSVTRTCSCPPFTNIKNNRARWVSRQWRHAAVGSVSRTHREYYVAVV